MQCNCIDTGKRASLFLIEAINMAYKIKNSNARKDLYKSIQIVIDNGVEEDISIKHKNVFFSFKR